MGDFDGRAVVVTGGGLGIGRAAAMAFAREGARVVIGDRDETSGEETARTILDTGGEASFLRTDVTLEADVKALIDHAVCTYGRLDAAFNNAGIDGDLCPLVDHSEENYRAVMDVNVKGVWLSMKYEIPRMIEQGGGAIVNNSSVAGLIGAPGMALYAASKHAVVGLTRSAALEYASRGVRVNAINPGVIDTEMVDRFAAARAIEKKDLDRLHPIGRIGRVEEVASSVLFLCSDRAAFVTGHCLAVDGGFTAQ